MSAYKPYLSHEQRRVRRKQMAEALASGGTVHDVAQQFGVSYATLRSAVREFGSSDPGHRERNSDKVFRILVEIVQGVMDYTWIADTFGVSLSYVSHIAKRAANAGFEFDGPGQGARARSRVSNSE